MSLNSGPHCYHCLTRGHPKEECVVTLLYEICESVAHVKGICGHWQEQGGQDSVFQFQDSLANYKAYYDLS
jgi:hypothetical protein